MTSLDKFTSEQERKIKEIITPELGRYRLLKGLESLTEEQEAFCRKVEVVVEGLPKYEKFLITERYLALGSEYVTDYEVYNFLFEPPISEKTYAKIRHRAMTKIALFMEIETGVEIKI